MRADVYKRVTDKIIADLERGVPTWQQPWQFRARRRAGVPAAARRRGKPYRGVNVMMLWDVRRWKNGYGSADLRMTYRQAARTGRPSQEGRERERLVVYAFRVTLQRELSPRSGKKAAKEKEIPFMKGYTAFNVDQIDGLPGHYLPRRAAAGQQPSSAST